MGFERLEYPEFSWSLSRGHVFGECLRKYYNQFYRGHNGWLDDALRDARIAWRLKQIKNLYFLVGSLLHFVAAEQVHRAVRGFPAEEAKELTEFVKFRLHQGIEESKSKALWMQRPNRWLMLHEIYYGMGITPDKLEEAYQIIERCIVNLVSSQTLAYIRENKVTVIEIDHKLSNFTLMDSKIYAVMDLFYHKGDKRFGVIDWKTGKEPSINEKQLPLYGFYATIRYGLTVDQLEFGIEGLLTGCTFAPTIDECDLISAEMYVRRSIIDMRQYLEDVSVNKPLLIDKFVPTWNVTKCRNCNYLELCQQDAPTLH